MERINKNSLNFIVIYYFPALQQFVHGMAIDQHNFLSCFDIYLITKYIFELMRNYSEFQQGDSEGFVILMSFVTFILYMYYFGRWFKALHSNLFFFVFCLFSHQ